jgi:hypothetical protein
MNSDGQIRHFESDEAARAAGYKTALSPKEYQAMLGHKPEDRPVELALMRFEQERAALGAPVTIAIRNAFRLGFRAGAQSQGESLK